MPLDGYHTVLVLGGIRSGKSEYAESLVADAQRVRYVATGVAPDPDTDPEWARRVAAHRERRPDSWTTDETGTDHGRLAALLAEAKPEETVLVEDLGGWLTAVLGAADWAAGATGEPVATLVEAVRGCAARVVLVSPEVGLSVVPETAAGRAFADALGEANRTLAGAVDGVVLVVAGQPTWLKRPGRLPGAGPVVGAAWATAAGGGRWPSLPTSEPTFNAGMVLPVPDEAASVAATERLRLIDVPGIGLGALGRLVSFAAGAQGTGTPRPFRSVQVLLVYGEHEGGVAAGEEAIDWRRRLREAQRGEGPLGLLAERVAASVRAVDVPTEGLGVARAVEDEDAMPMAAVDDALDYGWHVVVEAVEAGAELLILATAGPGQQAVASALVARTAGREAAAMLGRVLVPGGAIDDHAWMSRCAAIREALRRVHDAARDAKKLLSVLGGPDFAVAAGMLLGAAACRVPVVLDGPVGVAAALVARELATQVRPWSLVLDDGGHPAVAAGMDALGLEPLVKLGLGLGEGANALAALPLVQAGLLLSTLDTVPATEPSDEPAPDEAAPDEPAPGGA